MSISLKVSHLMILFMLIHFVSCDLNEGTQGQAENAGSAIDYGIDTTRHVPAGIDIGEKAPEFHTKDVNGNFISMSEKWREGPVVLIFYRGQWCPVCHGYLSRFKDSLDLIEGRNAQLIAVAPETVNNAKAMERKSEITFPVIADTTERIMSAYDVLFHVDDAYEEKIGKNLNTDIASNNNKEEARLPVPATYVINEDGKVVWRHFDLNYKNRASVKQILEALDAIAH